MAIKPQSVEIFDPPVAPIHTRLRARPGDDAFDPELLKRAEAAVQTFGASYLSWARDDLARLDAAVAALRREPDRHDDHVACINRIAFEMKGHGGSFGYMLMTEIGVSLEAYTREGCPAGPRSHEIIAAHVQAMHAVLADAIKGDGGEVGRAILAGLALIAPRRQQGA